MRPSCETVGPIVSGRRGVWQEAPAPQVPGEDRWPCGDRMPQENGRPSGAAVRAMGTILPVQGPGRRRSSATPTARLRPDRAVHRDRLQGDGAVGTADEDIGAEAGSDGHLAGRTEIVAGEKAASGADAVSEHAPHHHAAAGDADVEAELADRPAIDLLRDRLAPARTAQDTAFCDPMMKPMPAETSQVNRPGLDPLRGGWIDAIQQSMRTRQPRWRNAAFRFSLCSIANPIRVACLESILRKNGRYVAPPGGALRPPHQCGAFTFLQNWPRVLHRNVKCKATLGSTPWTSSCEIHFKLPQKRWMRRQASSTSSVLVA